MPLELLSSSVALDAWVGFLLTPREARKQDNPAHSISEGETGDVYSSHSPIYFYSYSSNISSNMARSFAIAAPRLFGKRGELTPILFFPLCRLLFQELRAMLAQVQATAHCGIGPITHDSLP